MFRSLDNFQNKAISIENIIEGMRVEILNQEETLEVLSTFVREFEQTFSSSIESLKNYIVNTGKKKTIFITFYIIFLRAKSAVQLVQRIISRRRYLRERAKKYFSAKTSRARVKPGIFQPSFLLCPHGAWVAKHQGDREGQVKISLAPPERGKWGPLSSKRKKCPKPLFCLNHFSLSPTPSPSTFWCGWAGLTGSR